MYKIKVYFHLHLHVNIQFSQNSLLKKLSFLPWMVLAPWQKIIWPYIWGFILGLFIPLVYMSACKWMITFNILLEQLMFSLSGENLPLKLFPYILCQKTVHFLGAKTTVVFVTSVPETIPGTQ